MAGSRIEVDAIHDDDVRDFLDRLGVLNAFERGDLVCAICASSLRDAGLGAARGDENAVAFACAKLDCLEDFHSL